MFVERNARVADLYIQLITISYEPRRIPVIVMDGNSRIKKAVSGVTIIKALIHHATLKKEERDVDHCDECKKELIKRLNKV